MAGFRKPTILIAFVAFQALTVAAGDAQTAAPPLNIGDVAVTGSFRTRLDSWNWFGDDRAGEYSFPGSLLRLGLSRSTPSFDWQLEAAVPFVLGVPNNATAAGARGALGPGALYFASNGNRRDAAQFFLKQGYVRFKDVAGVRGQTVKAGRFEFLDGTETTPQNDTVAALTRDRISQRLIGSFAFSHTGRSLDGAQYGFDRGAWNITAVAGRATRGTYDVNGWDELNVSVGYAAATRQIGSRRHFAEWRTFGIVYDDNRHGVLKVDNRTAAVRSRDADRITLETFGADYVRADATAAGTFDVLVWAAGQTGSWGSQTQRAGAFALEGGWQPDVAGTPWIRGGWNYGSGDGNAADSTHGTFFQLLPTPRQYARTPFFNMMNMSDAFVEGILHPASKLTIRSDVHALRLADTNDLWYQGGGAYQNATFGYSGRPSNGRAALATLADAAADVALSPRVTVSGYAGHAAGAAVSDAIYGGSGARFAYLEFFLRF